MRTGEQWALRMNLCVQTIRFMFPREIFKDFDLRLPQLTGGSSRVMRTYAQRKRHNEVATGLSFVAVALMVLSFMGLAQHFGLSLI